MEGISIKDTGTGSKYIQTWIRVGCNTFWGRVSVLALFPGSTINCHQKQELECCCLAIPNFWSGCEACAFTVKPE